MRSNEPRSREQAPRRPIPSAPVGFIGNATAPPRFNTTGAVDCLLGTAVLGWAYDRDAARRRVRITVTVDGKPAAETIANGQRRELVGVDGRDGFSGFICTIPPEKFQPGGEVRVFADGTEIGAAPLLLGPDHIDGAVEPTAGGIVSGWVRERVLEPARAVLDLVVDGRVLRTITADRPRPELRQNGVGDGRFGFAEPLPDECLDGGEHQIELRHRRSGTTIAPGEMRFRASFAGELDRLDATGGSGWAFCRERPDRPLRLDVIVNGERIAATADYPRDDVRDRFGVRACGFWFEVPPSIPRHRALSVAICVAGTANPAIPGPFSFTPASRAIEQLEDLAARIGESALAPGAAQSPLRETIVPAVIAALRAQARQAPSPEDTPRFGSWRFKGPAAVVADIVDVVIPVYGGHDETLACLGSVIAAAGMTRHEIVVVDDCGPDPRLRAALQAMERDGAVTLVANPVNLGFPGAANAGMSLHPDRDVILLNSDTLVPKGWIERLRAAAYRVANIGTVTPLSNRATICSYPEIDTDNDLPAEMSWEALDALCAAANDERTVEIPTAVGFCAYLRRTMLREVGLFDTTRWNKGYGEENELCILAAARGWRHVLAPNLFVVHHGAASFGAGARREALKTNMPMLNWLYPDYIPRIMDFLDRDPVAPVRRAIDWARLRALSGRFMLHVSHLGGGGTTLYVEDMARRLQSRGEHALILEANADDRGIAVVRNLALGTKSIYALPGDYDALVADLRAAGIWHIHFHQIMGAERWTQLPAQLDCPYDVTVHDYSPFCPRIDLIDEAGQYCGEPAIDVCQRCVSLSGPHPDLRDAFLARGASVANWLALHRRLLDGARRVFAPSQDTARRVEKHLPGIAYRPLPHPEPRHRAVIGRPSSDAAARVAVIGGIGINKGCDLLLACARDALKRGLPIEFRLFGFAANEPELRRLGNVRITGAYQRAELSRLVAENPCDLALFPGIWPETHCYALTDSYRVGLYPVALDFGAIGERIAACKVGTRLPRLSTPAAINAAILAEIARAEDWPESVEVGDDCDDILADYYGLDAPAPTPAPREPDCKKS